jgi:hypothetical protein
LVGNQITCDSGSCSLVWPQVTFNGIAGETYLIRATGLGAAEIDFMFTLSGPACDPGGTVTGDVDGDGVVGILDFLALLGDWGPCSAPCPPSCAADLDDDCTVGILDFLMLLANWS